MLLKRLYPRSFAALLLLGFGLVGLPLLAGMVSTGLVLDRMVREGARTVETTVEVTRSTRRLAENAVALERTAGQFYVLEDPQLKRAVATAHEEFAATVERLRRQFWTPKQAQLLERAAATEDKLYRRLLAGRSGRQTPFSAFDDAFDGLHQAVAAMAEAGNQAIDDGIAALRSEAAVAQQRLLLQGAAVLLLSLSLVGLFAWLINRPVGQLARAIRRLGENNLEPAPAINGSRDLSYLGQQVDWLRRRLLELEEQKQRFLRHVSHELKTPLTALREGVELLTDRVGGELTPQQAEIAGIMRGNARELQRRIEDLLRFNQAVHRGDALLLERCRLDELLEIAAHHHLLTLRARHLHLETDVGDLALEGDRGQLATVLENLIANAVRFSPEGGEIRVAARRDDGGVVVTVCDQGPGVAPEDRPHLFRPFHQGRNQPPGAVQGTGLGLAIVREYVEAHGGRVALEERATGGACFRVVLPLRQEQRDEA